MKTLRALTACMFLALAAQVSASATPSALGPASPGTASGSPAEVVVLPASTLDAVTGALNWGKIVCWTGVVVVAVTASGASPPVGAAASGALAIVCLATY